MHMGFGDTGHTGYSAILLPGIWDPYPRGGGGGTLIFSHIRRLGPFFWVQNSEFQYFLGFSEKLIILGVGRFCG